MKCPLSLLACLLVFPCLAQTKTASVTAYSRSLSLSATTTYNGLSTLAFTTADNSTGLPLYVPGPGGNPVFSNELRPDPRLPRMYESDFEVLAGTSPLFYGSLDLAITNQDANHDAIPDVLDPTEPMYTAVVGTGYTTWPSSNYFTMNLRFDRPADTPTGVFSGIWSFAGGSYIVNGTLNQLLLQGSAMYTRGLTNQLQLQLTRTLGDGTPTTLTGTVHYTATADQVSLPRFTLTSTIPQTNIITLTDTNTLTSTNVLVITNIPGPTYTALHTVLTRHGNRYIGNLSFVDGAPETPWPDYVNWILTLTDLNDVNSNGVPDISDPSPALLPSAPLVLVTNGLGSVSPALSGQNLPLGKTYHLTATPAVGSLFAGWSGDLVSSARTLTFTMMTNLNLQVNFVPNPFYPVSGTYYGLIEDTNNVSNQTLGAFRATTTAGGTYSVKFQLGGRSFSLSGALDSNGSSYPTIVPPNLRPLFVQLHLDLTNNTGISGSIGDGNWSAAITANKDVFDASANRCAFAGKYTFAMPSSGAYGSLPVGSSYGTVRVDAAGHVVCAAWLGDGTRVSQSTGLSATGDWPLYFSMYKHLGCLGGWLTFTNLSELPIAGLPVWVKPAGTTKYAAEGFTNLVTWLLSPYVAPAAGGAPVDWTNGLISFGGGDLAEPFSVDLELGSQNKLASTSTNKLSFRLLSSGLFQGRIVPPGAGRAVSFQGALIQDMGQGFGALPGPDASAEVELGPLLAPSVVMPLTNAPGVPQAEQLQMDTNLQSGVLAAGQFVFDTNQPVIQRLTAPPIPVQTYTPPITYPVGEASGAVIGTAFTGLPQLWSRWPQP